jgi:hypothetical protein
VDTLRLPATWPFAALFILFPLWWVLGVSAFILPLIAGPMLLALFWRRRTRAPLAFILWLAFVSWVFLSGLQIPPGTRTLTFAYRLSLYAGSAILFWYVYNMPRSRRLDSKVVRALTIFWMVVVAGGYAGIVLKSATFVPPVEHLIPHALRAKEFTQELISPSFSEVQNFLGYPDPRPTAPFAYTNQWGGNIAVLTPVVFACISGSRPGLWRKLVICVLVLSLVPMVISLNRGMFLSLALGIVYVTVRLAMRGRIGAFGSVVTLTALLVTIIVVTPLGHLVVASFSSTHGDSNNTRVSLYQQASAGANSSPLFGYGSPRPAPGQPQGTPAIGTQGQLWMVLYSNGYPAVVFLIGFILAVTWQTWRVPRTSDLWLHVVPLVALAQTPFYGWLPFELPVVMVVAALAYRRCWQGSAERDRTALAGDPQDGYQDRDALDGSSASSASLPWIAAP